MDSKTIGRRIEVLRTQRGLSLAELAREIGVTPQNLSEYRLGHVDIPASRIVKLAKALGATPGDLFMDAQSEESSQKEPAHV